MAPVFVVPGLIDWEVLHMPYSMTLAELVSAINSYPDMSAYIALDNANNALQIPISDITYDSRQVQTGSLFICKGAAFKAQYLNDAISNGATAYMSSQEYPGSGIPGIVVNDIRRAMAIAACAFFDHPSSKLNVIGITGTKGKTTTAYYIDAILRCRQPLQSLDHQPKNGMFTGLVIDDGLSLSRSHNTTPESVELQRHLAHAVDAGCDCVVMEASSQGLKYDRTLGTRFAVGMFTNIGEDHISPAEHPTFEDYFNSKLRIFAQSNIGIVNIRMQHVDEVLQAAQSQCERVITYDPQEDLSSNADVKLLACKIEGRGIRKLEVKLPSGDIELQFKALGSFNVDNAVAALAACDALGVDHEAMVEGLAYVRVPGRMEMYETDDSDLIGIIDYAHNGMSMRALLNAVRQEFPHRQITVVFGSCGTRALDRREGLGLAAGELADRIILTEDEPDTVDVNDICAEIGQSIKRAGGTYQIIEDREQAIAHAIAQAERPGVIVIAGKGAECTMLRNGVDQPYGPDAKVFCAYAGIPWHQ